jgi:hypothetical protein
MTFEYDYTLQAALYDFMNIITRSRQYYRLGNFYIRQQ